MFLSGIKAEDRSPWGHFWFEPVGVRTGSGVRVTADTAMSLSAVFRAVSLVSGHLALLPIRFYKKGTRQQITDHPVLALLNKRPNRWQNSFEWREMMQGHLELRGNAYNEIYSNGRGIIEELIPRHPDKVKIEVMSDGDYRYRITNPDGTTRTVSRGNIWHIRGLSSDGMVGLAVLEYARESFGLGLAAKSYGAKFFANDAKPTGGWIEYPGTYRDKSQKQAIRETLQDAQSGMNRGKLMMLDYGMKYHEVGPTNEDMQFLGTQQHSVDDIARWFGVPPHKIGSLERSTNNNIEQQALEYVTDALMTRASRNVAAIKGELLFDEEEFDVEYDFSEFLRGDSTALSNYLKTLSVNGIITRNEARAAIGKDPLPGLDRPLLPLNMVEEPDGSDPDADDAATKPVVKQKVPPVTPTNPVKANTDGRMAAMATAAAERVARKETQVLLAAMKAENWLDAVNEAMQKHGAFVASTLGISTELANSYIEMRGSDPIRKGHEEEDIYAASVKRLNKLALEGTI